MMVKVKVDGREIEVDSGQSLLAACLKENIYIPNLCYLEEMTDPPASCRLCFVDVEGERNPVAACKLQPREGMVVKTDTQQVRRLQRSALRLLLSVHHVDCKNCPSNKNCDLQRLSKFLGVPLKVKKLDHLERETRIDLDHPIFTFVPDRCILCAKCIHVCRRVNGIGLLTFAQRGFDTVVTCFGATDPGTFPCRDCGACVEVCPVSAIFLKQNADSNPSAKTA